MTAKAKADKPLESDVQKACIRIMQKAGWRTLRRNVGSFAMGSRYFRAGERGQSDTYGIIPRLGGRHFEVEIKRPGNRPSLHQVAWLLRCHHDGAVSFWVDSAEQCAGMVDAIMRGATISYEPTKRLYPVEDAKGKTIRDADGQIVKAEGPSGDYMVVFG